MKIALLVFPAGQFCFGAVRVVEVQFMTRWVMVKFLYGSGGKSYTLVHETQLS